MRRSGDFLLETLSQSIVDLRAKATRFRTQRLRVAEGMAADCAALAEAFEAAATTLQGHLAEAQGR